MKPGDFFRSYYVVDELGHGGMSVVHLCFDTQSHQFVAVKRLFSDLVSEEEYVRRFQREIRIYRSLNHPNIVNFVDAEISPSSTFLCLEYVRGQSLAEVMELHPEGLPLTKALAFIESLTNAVFHSHSKGVIHRDIQPRNIIIDGDEAIKLFDFGIAYTEDEIIDTPTGTIMGTFIYSSPEQNQGKRIDDRSDLYSLGLVLYEMLTGRRAVQGDTLLEITEFQLRREPIPPSILNPDVPDFLESIVLKLLKRWPEDRYRSARHLIDDLIQLKIRSTGEEIDLLFGDRVQVLWEQAKKDFKAGNYGRALQAAEKVLEVRSGSVEVLGLSARCLTRMGQGLRASAVFDRNIENCPTDPQLYVDYAIDLHLLEQPRKALKIVRQGLERHPTNRYLTGLHGVLERELALPAPAAQSGSSRSQGRRTALHAPVTVPAAAPYAIWHALQKTMTRKDPESALFLASLFPGLGHHYLGFHRRGATYVLAGILTLAISMLLLLVDLRSDLGLGRFVQETYVSAFSQKCDEFHLAERFREHVARTLRPLRFFMALCFVSTFAFLWSRSRRGVLALYEGSRTDGKVMRVLRPDLVEVNLGEQRGIEEGTRFVVMEAMPVGDGPAPAAPRIRGEARVLLVGQRECVCHFLPSHVRAFIEEGDRFLRRDLLLLGGAGVETFRSRPRGSQEGFEGDKLT